MGEQSSLTINEIIQLLPYRLRSRFESLSHYVRVVIHEELQRKRNQGRRSQAEQVSGKQERGRRLAAADIQVIQLIVLIYAIDQLFVEGTRAAQGAVDRLADLEMEGFVLGRSEFVGRNENVMRGQMLSKALRKSIRNRRLLAILRDARGVKSLILTAMGELSDGKSVD